MTTPRERPILFTGAMVRAILDGRKTQTRRPIVGVPDVGRLLVGDFHPTVVYRYGEASPGPARFGACTEDGEWSLACPLGRPGDVLWVREAFAFAATRLPLTGLVTYRADVPDGRATDEHGDPVRWTPSIHMPRSASRLSLRLLEVRVERACDISDEDIRAEGLETQADWMRTWRAMYAQPGKRWEDRPWVWVVRFEQNTAAQRQE